jgi:PTH1 family peptidyl-tRNA hydrolase
MKIVVGLGNPGKEYERTRHNMGFMVVDVLARRWNVSIGREKFQALVGDGTIAEERTVLLKPLTYMNLSGGSVLAAVQFHKIEQEDLLVVSDDLDLPTGQLRIRRTGGAGGHNGLRNIEHRLGTQGYARLRVGIDKGPYDATDHVLGGFGKGELREVEAALDRAADAVECWISQGIEAAMNRFNKIESE